jgi:hypothetical protein
MAVYLAAANGNLSDAAGTWDTVDATSYLYSVAANTALTTAYVESQAFTPGAITIDGIVVHISSRASAPVGTMSIRLAQGGALVAGTEVTINVSDIDRPGGTGLHAPGLYLFKFAAPVLLLAATPYTVSAKTSSAAMVNLYRNATAGNWSRMLRTTTAANPGAGDEWHVLGEWTAAATKTNRTIAMDETAVTDYGSASTDLNLQSVTVGKGGTLACNNAGATNYMLQVSGGVRVWGGGIFTYGTVASPIPITSTATLQFDCAADGDFGLLADGTFTAQGVARTSGKNVVQVLLNTDEAAAQTVLGVDTDCGWLNGDIVDIASTSRTFSQSEQRTMSADASATTITVSAGLTNAHSGTSPTQAEVILVTRNVIIRSVSTTAMAFATFGDTSTVDLDWVWFRYLGAATNYKFGVQIRTQSGGSFDMRYCSVTDFETQGIYIGGTSITSNASVSIRDCGLTSRQNAVQQEAFVLTQTDGQNITIDRITVTANDGASGARSGFSFDAAPYATISNIRASGCEASGIDCQTPTSLADLLPAGTMSSFTAHSNANHGIGLSGNFPITITTVSIWRNNNALSTGGLNVSGPGEKVIDGGSIFGNSSNNIFITAPNEFIGKSLTVAGDTTFSTATGLSFNGSSSYFFTRLENCSFGDVSGIFAAHTSQDITFGGGRKTVQLILVDTLLDSATELASTGVLQGQSVIRYQRVDQATAVHKSTYYGAVNGTVEYDTAVFRTAAPSEKMSPTSVYPVWRMRSQVRRRPIRSGQTASISVYVRKSAAYNGSAPRLILLSNPAVGIDSDVVAATHAAIADTWELLSYTTAAASEDGVVSFYVDCDGSAGSVYTEDWA